MPDKIERVSVRYKILEIVDQYQKILDQDYNQYKSENFQRKSQIEEDYDNSSKKTGYKAIANFMASAGFLIIGGVASAFSGNDHYKSLPKTISNVGVPMSQNAMQGISNLFDKAITKSNASAQMKDQTYKEVQQNSSRVDSNIDTISRIFQRVVQAS